MVMQELERQLRRADLPGDQKRADQIAAMLKDRGVDITLPNQDPKLPYTLLYPAQELGELDPKAEWRRQANRYIELGFHRMLEVSEDEYLTSLPRLGAQPRRFAGRFDVPVIVERRINPFIQARMAGLSYDDFYLGPEDWEGDPKSYKTPDVPYVTWMQLGRKNISKSIEAVRKNLAPDERGATIHDGIALFITRLSLLKEDSVSYFIDLPGTSSGRMDLSLVRYIRRNQGIPRIKLGYFSGRLNGGSATCGRQIKTF